MNSSQFGKEHLWTERISLWVNKESFFLNISETLFLHKFSYQLGNFECSLLYVCFIFRWWTSLSFNFQCCDDSCGKKLPKQSSKAEDSINFLCAEKFHLNYAVNLMFMSIETLDYFHCIPSFTSFPIPQYLLILYVSYPYFVRHTIKFCFCSGSLSWKQQVVDVEKNGKIWRVWRIFRKRFCLCFSNITTTTTMKNQ